MKKRRLSFTTRYVVIVGVLLFAANTLLGIVLMNQSRNMIDTMIRKNMLDISNTTAQLLDGDVMAALTEDDVGTPAYQKISDELAVFQRNAEIEFIYTVRQTDDDRYVFTVDPDPIDPGQFGEAIVITDALKSAGNGTAAVDRAPSPDRWGNFCSAFSPILDSRGEVAGIVGVDFSSEWYSIQTRNHTLFIGLISMLSVMFGAAVMVLITGKLRRKFLELEQGLSALSRNVDELTEEIVSNPGYRESFGELPPPRESDINGVVDDEIEALSVKIESMQHTLERYLAYMHAQAYTDSLTGVGNTNAYQEELNRLNERIAQGEAEFSVAVFDIDNLKIVNDRFGHACGDRIIRGAGSAIARVFGKDCTYRIGGDEFLAMSPETTLEEMNAKLREIEKSVAEFNAAPDHPEAELSLSMGAAVCMPGTDRSFREVFVRADEAMYTVKGEHHRMSALCAM